MYHYSLNKYLEEKRITDEQYNIIRALLKDDKNIIIGGHTGAGKTTFLNTLIKEICTESPSEFFCIIDDTKNHEITCDSNQTIISNPKHLHEGVIWSARRANPDRLIISELRKTKEVVEWLEVLNTFPYGGITTMHCTSGHDLIEKIKDVR